MSARWYCYRCERGGDYTVLGGNWEFCPTCGARLSSQAPAERFPAPPEARAPDDLGPPAARNRWVAIVEELAPPAPRADPRATASSAAIPEPPAGAPRAFLRFVDVAGAGFMIPTTECRVTTLGEFRDPWLGPDGPPRRATFADVTVHRTAEFAAVDFRGMVGSRVEVVTKEPSGRWVEVGVFFVKAVKTHVRGPGRPEVVDLQLSGISVSSQFFETPT